MANPKGGSRHDAAYPLDPIAYERVCSRMYWSLGVKFTLSFAITAPECRTNQATSTNQNHDRTITTTVCTLKDRQQVSGPSIQLSLLHDYERRANRWLLRVC